MGLGRDTWIDPDNVPVQQVVSSSQILVCIVAVALHVGILQRLQEPVKNLLGQLLFLGGEISEL